MDAASPSAIISCSELPAEERCCTVVGLSCVSAGAKFLLSAHIHPSTCRVFIVLFSFVSFLSFLSCVLPVSHLLLLPSGFSSNSPLLTGTLFFVITCIQWVF